MPIYEYVCGSCSHKFEALRPMSRSNDPAACPECSTDAVRIMSVFASNSMNEMGVASAIAGGGSSCSGCASTSCGTCKH